MSAITTVYYIYQEGIAFLKAASLEILPLEDDVGGRIKRRAPSLTLDEDAIELVYKVNDEPNEGRHAEAMRWLDHILLKVLKAITEIEAVAKKRWYNNDLAKLIEHNRDNAERYRNESIFYRLDARA